MNYHHDLAISALALVSGLALLYTGSCLGLW